MTLTEEVGRLAVEMFLCEIGKARPYVEKADKFSILGKYKKAIKCIDKAIKLAPNKLSELYDIKGEIYLNSGEYDEALIWHKKSIELKPDFHVESSKYSSAMVFNDKSKYLLNQKKFDEALKCIDIAIEFYPDEPYFYSNKGEVLSKMGKYEEALELLNKTITLKQDTTSFEIYFQKGLALSRLNRFEESLICYDKAIELNPNFPASYYGKITVLISLGKASELLGCFDKLMTLDPDNLELKRLRDKYAANIKAQ